MKNSLLQALLVCIFLLFQAAQAQTTRFDPGTGILTISCVALYSGDVPLVQNNKQEEYAVKLQMVPDDRFALLELNEAAATEHCSGKFDADSGRYTDLGRIGDEAWTIRMELDEEGYFHLSAAEFARWADTSLWRVSNGTNELFLGGAVHILGEQHYPLPQVFENVYLDADVVIMEIDISLPSEEFDPALFIRTDGGTLQNDLSMETYEALRDYLRQFENMPPLWQLNQWKPAAIAMLLDQLEMMRLGYTQPGVDYYYALKAIDEGKTTGGLETAASQQDVVLDTYEASAEEMIATRLYDIHNNNVAPMLELLIHAWREADLQLVLNYVVLPWQVYSPDYYDALLVQRNLNWMPQLEQMLENEERELVLVGLAHLVGEHSVLTLLEERGYTVELYRE